MKIQTTKEVIQKAVQVGEIAQHDRIYFCDSTPRARRYVDVEQLIDRIETICNHGNERDMRFRNHLLRDLNKPLAEKQEGGLKNDNEDL